MERIERARRFSEQSLAPRRGVEGFDHLAWQACAREGYLSMLMPTDWSGQGCCAVTATEVFAALGRGGADRGLLFAMGAHVFACCTVITKFGSAAQRERYAEGLASGQFVSALAVTEPSGGSSFGTLGTVAKATSDGFILSGTKTLITNAPQANLFVVLARDNDDRKNPRLTAFLVPAEEVGLRVEPFYSTVGLQGAPMGRVILDQCQVPGDAVLGEKGEGMTVFSHGIAYERTCVLAGLWGAAHRDLELCISHATQRTDQRGPLVECQAVAHRLARMKCRLEAAGLVMMHGAGCLAKKAHTASQSARVKLTVSETLVDCAMDGLKVFAGAGWLDEHGIGTALRDVVGTLSASGTSDVLLNTIAAELRETR